MNRARVVASLAGLFAVVAILTFIAGLIPALKGERPNFTFLGAGVVFLAVAGANAANARKMRKTTNAPPAA
jgi:hypothetical protein